MFLYVSPSGASAVAEAAQRMKLITVLAAMQIVEQALSRMRFSTQGRILAELAIVRVCHLDELDELPELVAQLRAGHFPATPGAARMPASPLREKKTPELQPSVPSGQSEPSRIVSAETVVLSDANAADVWRLALQRLSVMAAAQGELFSQAAVDGPGRLVISFPPEYALAKSCCERPENAMKLEDALKEVTGRVIRVRFAEGGSDGKLAEGSASVSNRVSSQQRLKDAMENPVIRRVHDLFGATPLRVDRPDD